jgi:N-formylglutamate amidohydrolase
VSIERTDFEVRPGHRQSSVLLHVPHAGTRIPADVRVGIDLGDDALRREVMVMTDARTDGLATSALYGLGVAPTLVINHLSRLVVDPERFLDERETLDAVGMGAVYTRTHDGQPLRSDDPAERGALIDRYFHPYTRAVEEAIDEVLGRKHRCVLIDLHSYPPVALPYEQRPQSPRPQICLGIDPSHTPSTLLDQALDVFADHGFEVKVDTPFSGAYVPPRYYGVDERVASIMVEVRRDAYLRDGFATFDPAGSRHVVAALRDLISLIDVSPLADLYASTHLDIQGLSSADLTDGVIITAANPHSAEGTTAHRADASPDPERDASANAALAEELRLRGLAFFSVDAHAPDPDEHAEASFFVPGMDLDVALELGRRFEQNAVFQMRGRLLRVIVCATGRVLSEEPFDVDAHDTFVRVHAEEPR